MNLDRKNIENLRLAIVEQACMDWQNATLYLEKKAKKKKRKKNYYTEHKINEYEYLVSECEDFFKSEWFKDLYEIDGTIILNKLRQITAEGIKMNRTRTKTGI